MMLKEFPASRATAGVVRVYRLAHFIFAGAQSPAVKVYPPRPEPSLQFFLREPELAVYPDGRRLTAGSVLTGLHDVCMSRVVPNNFLMIQVAFEPAGLHRLLGVPAEDLHNQYIDAELVLGLEVRRVRERMQEASSYVGVVEIADAYVAQLAERRSHLQKAEPPWRLLRDRPSLPVGWVAHRSGIGARQFERVCIQRLGMPPKRFARLARFDRAFQTKLRYPEQDWLSIAIACGYVDYQHMARDFRAFAGETPAQAVAMQSAAPERLLGVAPDFRLTAPWAEM